MPHDNRLRHICLTFATLSMWGFAAVTSAGDFFVQVSNATAGSFLGPGLTPGGLISGQGMDDGNAGLKTALSDNQSTGFGMWLTDFFATANGYTDPNSDAWVTFDFGEVVSGIDQLLVWNYNQETVTSRGMRRVDITYSADDASGLGNLLYDDYILTEGTGLPNMPFTDDIPLGTPGVGINARSIRITAHGGEGDGNFGNPQDFYGLSEVRFYSVVNPLPPGLRVWDAQSGNWTFQGSWDLPDPPVTSEYSALFGDSIDGPATVFTNEPVVVNSIVINNANSYAFAGNGVITLDTTSGDASISVLGTGDVDGAAGSHQFQIPVALGTNTNVVVGQDSSLAFNNQIDLAGNMLSLSGSASINHSVIDSVGGGVITVSGGTLGTAGNTGLAATLVLEDTTLDVDLSDSAGGVTPDVFNVQGSATLSGNITVDVDAFGSFVPGGNVPILTTTDGITNNSLGISLLGSAAGLFTGVQVVGNDLVLLTANGITGDYNQDGIVNLADYTVWRDALGSSDTLPNDPIGGVVGTGQYQQWKSQFGATGSATALTSAIPEPTTATMIFVSILGIFALARVRSSTT